MGKETKTDCSNNIHKILNGIFEKNLAVLIILGMLVILVILSIGAWKLFYLQAPYFFVASMFFLFAWVACIIFLVVKETRQPKREPMTSSNIKTVLNAIVEGIEKDNENSFESVASIHCVQEALEAVKNSDYDAFFFSLIYPFSNMVDGLLSKELPNSPQAQFLFKNSHFVENHFKRLIEKFEGSACCADKSRTIMKHLLRFLKTGKEISFDYTQKYTYHLPVLIFNTHDEITTFFKALNHLYYGSPEPYLQALSDIYNRMDSVRVTQ